MVDNWPGVKFSGTGKLIAFCNMQNELVIRSLRWETPPRKTTVVIKLLMFSRLVYHDMFCWLLFVASMQIMAISIIKPFLHTVLEQLNDGIFYSHSNFQGANIKFVLSNYSCNVPNISNRPQAVGKSVDCCTCVLPFFIFSETQYLL